MGIDVGGFFGKMGHGLKQGMGNLKKNAPQAINRVGSSYGGQMQGASQLSGGMFKNRPGMGNKPTNPNSNAMAPPGEGMVRLPSSMPGMNAPPAIAPNAPNAAGYEPHNFRFGPANGMPQMPMGSPSGFGGFGSGFSNNRGMAGGNAHANGMNSPLWNNYGNLTDDSGVPGGRMFY